MKRGTAQFFQFIDFDRTERTQIGHIKNCFEQGSFSLTVAAFEKNRIGIELQFGTADIPEILELEGLYDHKQPSSEKNASAGSENPAEQHLKTVFETYLFLMGMMTYRKPSPLSRAIGLNASLILTITLSTPMCLKGSASSCGLKESEISS